MLYHKEKELSRCAQAFLEGDDDAFNEFARIALTDIVNIAYHYTSHREDAKDIAQEVLLKIYRKLHHFHKASKLSTWIYRITINASIDYVRKRRIKAVSLDEAVTQDTHTDVRAQVDSYSVKERLERTIQMLSPRQRNVIVLKHFQGLTVRQISSVLGCSQSSVKTHLVRAVMMLRRELGGKDEMRR